MTSTPSIIHVPQSWMAHASLSRSGEREEWPHSCAPRQAGRPFNEVGAVTFVQQLIQKAARKQPPVHTNIQNSFAQLDWRRQPHESQLKAWPCVANGTVMQPQCAHARQASGAQQFFCSSPEIYFCSSPVKCSLLQRKGDVGARTAARIPCRGSIHFDGICTMWSKVGMQAFHDSGGARAQMRAARTPPCHAAAHSVASHCSLEKHCVNLRSCSLHPVAGRKQSCKHRSARVRVVRTHC
jgi:hypothetical protein